MLDVAPSKLQSYDCVAAEYYDAHRHPTCANFAELSQRFLAPRIRELLGPHIRIAEIGAGRSITAPILAKALLPLDRLVLLDRSSVMLSYSVQWACRGTKLLIADARATALSDSTFDVVVSALGDPYNTPPFWRETARLLAPGGICLFTSPAWEWAIRFRGPQTITQAEFLLDGNRRVIVPSFVLPAERQIKMVADSGLDLVEIVDLSRTDLTQHISAKLDLDNGATKMPVVRGFTIHKPNFKLY